MKLTKPIALIAALTLLLTGCDNTGENSHQPSDWAVEDSGYSESADYSGNASDSGESNCNDSSYDSAVGSDSASEPTESSVPDSDISEPDNSSEPDSDISDVSEPHVSSSGGSTSNNTSSSSTTNSTSTSSKQSEPPVVVIPEIVMPTSPKIKTASGAAGVIDYSNANSGYISAYYTGSKARSKLTIKKSGEDPYNYDLNINGKIEYFPLSSGNGTYTVTLLELISGRDYSIVVKQDIDVQMTNPRAPFTYPNQRVNYSQSSNVVKKSAEVTAGKTGTIDKIAAVFQWVTDNITYDYALAATVTSGYLPNPDTTLSKRSGICFDYASLMAAMLRAQGIPTRLVVGYAYSNPEDIYHAWNEVYTEQTGWITPELLLKNNGYNIADATFYAGTTDKKGISSYISNSSNYSAIYYY